jgi:hypothetical protein
MLRQFARNLRDTYYIDPFVQVRLLHLWLVIAACWWGLTPWTMLTRAFEQWSMVVVFVLLGLFAKPVILILRQVGFVALSWIAFSGFAWAGWFAGHFHHYTTPTNQHYVLTREIPVAFTYHRTASGFHGRITNLSRDDLSQAKVECDLFHRDGTPARKK